MSVYVNIRTPTSTRRPVRRSSDIFAILEIVFDNGELQRNEEVKLDITCIPCTEEHTDKDCAVCQNGLVLDENVSVLPVCRHVFHFECINEWGKYKQDCPLCKREIPVLN